MLIVSPEAASAIAVVSDEAPLYSTPVRTFFVWHGGGPATAAGAIRTTEIATRPSANAAGPCTVRLPRICTMALLPSFSEDRRCPPCTSMSEAARVLETARQPSMPQRDLARLQRPTLRSRRGHRKVPTVDIRHYATARGLRST